MPRRRVEMREEIAGYAIGGARGARYRMTERPDRIDVVELRGALRRNPDLRGKLLVRFRIEPSGKVRRAETADGFFPDTAYVNAILEEVSSLDLRFPGGAHSGSSLSLRNRAPAWQTRCDLLVTYVS